MNSFKLLIWNLKCCSGATFSHNILLTNLLFVVFGPPFQALSQNSEKRMLTLSCLSLHLSICMEQLGFHCTLIFDIFSTTCRENWSLPISDKNKVYFTWRRRNIYSNISLNSP
jgi:hypothetical protein